MPETIGDRIRRLRMEQGLSQRQLATTGVSYAYISRLEAGKRTPSVKALRKLAERLGVTADYLETGYNLYGEMADLFEELYDLANIDSDTDLYHRCKRLHKRIQANKKEGTGII